jgi:pimeloyl-ACP methyl ester carboxylesterase
MTGPISGEFKVLAITQQGGDTFIDLPRNLDTRTNAIQSLFWDTRRGHLVVQAVANQNDNEVVRFKVLRKISLSLPEVGNRVWLSGWLGEEPSHFGLEDSFNSVTLENGSTGWLFNSDSTKWVIHVHGRRAAMGETLRNIKQFQELGYTQLTISMATDPKPLGLGLTKSQLGETEWKELEYAISFAEQNGAKEILFVSWSQGAFITGQLLRNSRKLGSVRGAIFDSPLVDYRSTMRFQAAKKGFAIHLGDRVVEAIGASALLRLLGYPHIDVDQLSLKKPFAKDVSVLVIYSSEDGHVATHDVHALAASNPSATLFEIPRARHCRLFNEDQMAYQKAISDWLLQEKT